MFTYFHCYLPETWDAQVKAGLINNNSGIRFCESIDIEEQYKFNVMAKKGGALYNIIKETRLPFYIDRLQGGCFIEKYNYDMSLVNDYRNMLGDKFYGFQMHEWMSNYRNDIRKLVDHNCPSWSKEDIIATIKKIYPFAFLFLESMDADEMVAFGNPDGYEMFLNNSISLFRDRQNYVNGDLFPCDSYFLSYPIEVKNGAKRLMPEIGAQTPDTRIQVAYARGTAKAKNLTFGTYYEPWGGKPFSACCYQKDNKNEWNEKSDSDFPFVTQGVNGGSSRSMQKRMHLYSYMAGASFISEEWGMCNTFYDWNDFELSPYGEVKKNFIDFTEKYPDIGEPFAPIAVVLPADLPAIEGIHHNNNMLFSYPIFGSFADKVSKVRNGLIKLFCESGQMLGNETTSLLNCVIPDALDIVNEDLIDCDKYSYIVDLTSSVEFAKKHKDKIIDIDEVKELLDRMLPCLIDGNSMKQFTKTDDGSYYILLTNNSGVVRTCKDGEQFLSEATETQKISVKDNRSLIAIEGAELTLNEDGNYYTEIPAGGYFFGKIG